MKKILLYVFLIILLISTILLTIFSRNSDKYDLTCHNIINTSVDGEIYKIDADAYLNTNNDNVNYMKLVYKTSKDDYLYDENESKSYVELYKNISGIDYSVNDDDEYYYDVIEYYFDKIDLDNVANELGDLLDDESFLIKNNFSTDLNTVKKYFLNDYSCK